MTERERSDRLAMRAATAWQLAEQGMTLREIAAAMGMRDIYLQLVWDMLEMHQKARTRR